MKKIVDKTKLAELKQEIQENKVIYYYLTEEKFIIYSPKLINVFL